MTDPRKGSEEVVAQTGGSEEDITYQIRNAWRIRTNISTLPRWTQVQNAAIEQARASLRGADPETMSWILRELLLTLRCHQCERKLTDKCNFSICIRGLLSGVE
jgi:hypothetical protein